MLLAVLSTLGAVALAFGLWFWWACATPTSTFFRPVLVRGPGDRKRITLTFDDGPAEQFTDQILDILREHQVPATFFVCGRSVEKRPEILTRIVAEGHAVGNHTLTHPYLFFKSRRRMSVEIDRTQEIIEKVVGFRPRIFRPPYGSRWFGLVPTLEARGMKLIQWSATGYDWKKDARGIVESALRELHPGAVILLHDGRETRDPSEVDRTATVQALPELIQGARNQGYEFVALSDFLPKKF
jgi:peptidoglycan/xylan/chitin deacetylase (PgdA/CDA1 family)